MLIKAIMFGAALVAAPTALAQTNLERAGQRLIERSGAPERFSLGPSERTIEIIDTMSGLRCSIPPNASEMSLSASPNVVECGYDGGVYVNWMVAPLTSGAGRAPLDRFVAAYALFQKQRNPTWDVTAPPPPLAQLRTIYPNAPEPYRVWLRDTRDGVDVLVSLLAADINGHRVMQMVAGPADPVTALSELSFYTSTAPAPQ